MKSQSEVADWRIMRAEELWKAYWRAVHEEFFTKEFEEIKTEFNGQIRILCEEFQVVYDCTATYQK